jgi:hypothetical protein
MLRSHGGCQPWWGTSTMLEFHVPAASVFQSWPAAIRPVSVIRLRCTEGHDVAEWWRTPERSNSSFWTGRAPGAVREDAVRRDSAPTDAAPNPDERPYYRRLWLRCPRPTCNYSKKMTKNRDRLSLLAEALDPNLADALMTQMESV